MLLRDNKFGNRRSDALRRDFTINALYFDPCAGIIIDYFDGMSALKAKSIQIVGCPKKRFREDPIRILRAIRFAAKLQWPLGKALSLEIQTSKDQIYHASAERLLVEVQKFLMTGHAVDSFYKAMDEGLVSMLFPAWSHAWEACFDDNHKAYIQGLLYAIDKRYKHQETLSLSFALAALFWPLVLVNMRAHASEEIDAPADWLQSKAYWTIKKQSFADMTCLLHISAELKRRIEGLFDFQCGLYQIENASMLDSKTAPQGIQMMSLLCRHHLFPWQLAQQWHERFYQA